MSFTLPRGEFVLVVGSSGSGKSTLLNMIGLLDKPTKGSVIIDGTDTSNLQDAQISSFRNEKLGFVFQFSNLLSDLTVLENVMLPKQIQDDTSNVKNTAMNLLKLVGLEDIADRSSNKISGGQAQRVAIARGLINSPVLVLADEPTGNLDSKTADVVIDLMKSTAKKLNQTFVVVTHDKSQFGDVDRIITIKDGRHSEQSFMMELRA
ncbi:MAG: ABC transporter ATP-binding protein [Candidatus Nitrosoabyssus spongiisocia]|nr:MAG: ABC transporter ATP-binding protein [Nitrosopumilaceae archaeon AB1(1)]